ncbi:MAG: hypothetical protein GY747_06650 [Planctomycetes bacterium]|nr:hypothetical protein [Planctomycetota bacterium]MCP4860196.1 hypothetical protein [Planctomycetota bacterium]
MSPNNWDSLRSELNGLNDSASQALSRTLFMDHLGTAVRRYLWTPAIVMGLWVIVQVIARLFESEGLRSAWWQWLLVALAAFVVRVLMRVSQQRSFAIDRAQAIGEWDSQLHLSDRLLAADDFLTSGERSAFEEAAVEDAAERIARTREASLHFDQQPWQASALTRPALVMLLLVLTGGLVGQWQAPLLEEPPTITVQLPGDAVEVDALTETDSTDNELVQPENGGETAAPSTERQAVAETRAYSADIEEKSKESEGKTGSGRSAAAESSTGAGNSKGTPSQQGQISKPAEEKTKAKRKPPKAQKPHKQDEQTKKEEEQESGSTAGRGSSRGSNRNPASSDWSSKDHVNTPDDDNLEEEEETEDEEEEQEARGGMQPNLRDRRPPVSRDLSIGFGNQPSPDANGRGGPSQPKKSRGTASLVLGVPIPDRVKGQPNPGKTKITQERVQPKAESQVSADAQIRQPRSSPSAALQRQDLEPWMRSLVRDYFLAQRQQAKKP